MKNYAVKILKSFYSLKDKQSNHEAVVDFQGKRRTNFYAYVKTVNSIAKYLIDKKVKAADIVWIELGRQMEHLAVRMACHFIGAAFVSVNPEHPQARKEAMWNEILPKIKIDNDRLKEIKIDDYKCQINETIQDEEIGYIVYTSGTTSKPKGIVHDRSIYELIYYAKYSPIYRLYKTYIKLHKKHFIVGSMTDMMFILSMMDFALLFLGETIHLISKKTIESPKLLREYFNNEQITITFIIPALLKLMLPLPYLLVAVILGESSSFNFKHCGIQIINFYGASEAPIISFEHSIFGNVVGRTFKNSKIYLTNKYKGKVCFTGPAIMRKYLNNKEMTKKTIGYNKKTNYRIFYSQDVASYTKFHKIKLIGREDSTVKIHGKRVDKAEVESNIVKIKEISEVAVVEFGEEKNLHLTAFYTTDSGQSIDENYLIDALRDKLPNYMIPLKFKHIIFFPRNSHGKLDRTLLEESDTAIHAKYVAPVNTLEKQLCKAYSKVFDIKKIGINDDFILLGGDSLLAMKVLSDLKELSITVSDLYTYRTPNKLAKKLKIKETKNIKKYKRLNLYPLNDSANFVYRRTKSMTVHEYNSICNFNLCNVIQIKFGKPYKIKQIINLLLDKHLLLKARIIEKDNVAYFFRRDDWYPTIEIIDLTQKPDAKFFSTYVKPFDLFKDDLFRCKIFQYKNNVYLYVDIHHIVSDGYSQYIFFRDFFNLYRGKISGNENINSFDLILSLKDIFKQTNKEDIKFFKKIIQDGSFTKYPLSKKPDLQNKAIYKSCVQYINKSKFRTKCLKHHTTMPLVCFSALILALKKILNKKNILIWFFTNGRNVNINDLNNIACLYREYPFRYIDEGEQNIYEIANKIKEIKLKCQMHNFSNFDFPESIHQHNIVFNYIANDLNNDIFEKLEKTNLCSRILFKPEKYCNNHIEVDVTDFDSKTYGINIDYNASMYSQNDILLLLNLIIEQLNNL